MTARVLLDGRVTIHQGDVLEQLRLLPDNSVHCVVTSPPYFGLRNYSVAGQLGLEPTLDEHIAIMVEVFRELRRVLRPDGVCWVNYGDCYASSVNGRSAADTKALGRDDRTFRDKPFSTVGGIFKPKDLMLAPQRLAIALHADGWWVRSQIPWLKRNAMPESTSDRPATAIEYVFLLTKSERYAYDAEAVKRASGENTHARIKMPDGWDTGPGGHGSFHRQGREKGKTTILRPKLAKAGSGVRANGSFEAGMSAEILPSRNMRNTDLFYDSLEAPWGLISDGDGTPLALDVPSASFSEAHFATFPTALVEPLIKAAAPTKVCPDCGAGWVRVVVKGRPDLAHQRACGGNAQGAYDGSSRKDYATAGAQDASATKARILAGMRERVTSGFRPTCTCYDERYLAEFSQPSRGRKRRQRAAWGGRLERLRARPGLDGWRTKRAAVLDCFGGAGTVAVVATRLGRDSILIELNPTYVEMAAARIEGDWLGEDARRNRKAKKQPADHGPLFQEMP